MTREEAILYMTLYRDSLKGSVSDLDKDIEAYNMAIKALELEPSGETVSHEAVIEWLKAKDIIKLSSQEETARKELKALPSVNPQEPKTDVLDEIRAEISKLLDLLDANSVWYRLAIKDCLKVIDKYRKEQE